MHTKVKKNKVFFVVYQNICDPEHYCQFKYYLNTLSTNKVTISIF